MAESNKNLVYDLFRRHHHELYGYLMRRLRGNAVEAKDVAQETYLRLLRMKDTSAIRQPQTYLYKVASHVVRELMLIERKHLQLPSRLTEQLLDDETFDSPDTQLDAESSVQQLQQLLDRMPPTYKAVLLLRKREGLSHQEIARKLEISPHTVKKYMFRALAWCRENSGQIIGDE